MKMEYVLPTVQPVALGENDTMLFSLSGGRAVQGDENEGENGSFVVGG